MKSEYMLDSESYVVIKDDRIIGFISLMGQEIGGLFIDPLFNRQGYGTLLLQLCFSLRSNWQVKVFSRNKIAREFYKKAGFKKVYKKIHSGSGEEMIIMEFQQLIQ
ncbi:MAG: GNAT family N-acetyltransferase [Fulvivirga sp.]|uniref:GNAT family N-acetyltransferase n=1 Tax=Fulvivirga sp. TaxID=1931237 RepID=UPI0032EC82C4